MRTALGLLLRFMFINRNGSGNFYPAELLAYRPNKSLYRQ